MIPLTNAPTAITAGCRTARRAALGARHPLFDAGGPPGRRTRFPTRIAWTATAIPRPRAPSPGNPCRWPVFATNAFKKSVHAKLNCTDCHNTVKDLVASGRTAPGPMRLLPYLRVGPIRGQHPRHEQGPGGLGRRRLRGLPRRARHRFCQERWIRPSSSSTWPSPAPNATAIPG